MNHAADSRPPRRVEQRQGVLHRLCMGEGPVIETNPVGVVEHVHSGQRRRQLARIGKRERIRANFAAERIRPGSSNWSA
jgi:hypothetical protein